MESRVVDTGSERIESLMLDLGRVHQWTAMYASGHPFLRERIGAVHAALVAQAAMEPEGILLLGIARDTVLHKEQFFKLRHPLVLAFAEELYRHHVATIGFGTVATPEGVATFFRCLRELQAGKYEEIPEGYFQREGIRGIYISPVDYKEILSREIAGTGPAPDEGPRGEALWKALLAAREADQATEDLSVEELVEFPDLLPILLRRLREASLRSGAVHMTEVVPGTGTARAVKRNPAPGANPPGEGVPSTGHHVADGVSQEVLHRMFRRLGQTLRVLPEERRKKVLECLEGGMGDGDGNGSTGGAEPGDSELSAVHSLVGDYSDTEFLELFAEVLSMERKGGNRILRVFQLIAAEKDVEGSLVPLLKTWSREGHQTKEYYLEKTWEALEKLLLGRSEETYLGDDHLQFLESVSKRKGRGEKDKEPGAEADPALAWFLDPRALRRKGVVVLDDLLRQERREEEFLGLLAEAREAIPRLIEEREFALLDRILDGVTAAGEDDPENRREATSKVLASVDYCRLAEICFAVPPDSRESREGRDLLARYGARSGASLLDRLLVEQDKGMRRVLIDLLIQIGAPVVPPIVERLRDQPWYFLRNLCFILGEIGAPETVPALSRMLAHKDQRVRRDAIQALGKLRATDPEAIGTLGRILLTESFFASHKEDPIRIDAANSLFRISGVEPLAYLHRACTCRRAAVREHCKTLLRTRRKE